MERVIKTVEGIGKVAVTRSSKGEPLFVGVVKLGKKKNYGKYVLILGTLIITIIVLKIGGII